MAEFDQRVCSVYRPRPLQRFATTTSRLDGAAAAALPHGAGCPLMPHTVKTRTLNQNIGSGSVRSLNSGGGYFRWGAIRAIARELHEQTTKVCVGDC